MNDYSNIRPKLKHSSVFLQTERGLFIQHDDDEGGLLLKGKSIGAWVSALSPYLTGEFTLEQLRQRVRPSQQDQVVLIVNTLLQKGVLKNKRIEPLEVLPQAVQQRFCTQIEYLDHFVEYPYETFKQFRQSKILLLGEGETLKFLALSLLRNGLQRIDLASTSHLKYLVSILEEEGELFRQAGCDLEIRSMQATSYRESGLLDGYDVIVYCADNNSLQDIATLNKRCVHEQRAFLPATIFAGQAILGPYIQPREHLCWFCLLLRLSSNKSESEKALLWSSMVLNTTMYVQDEVLREPVARRIGHSLGFELFKLLTASLPAETEQSIIFHDLQTLESFSTKLVRHPLCPVCSHATAAVARQRLEDIVMGRHDHAMTQQDAYQKQLVLVNARVGAFHSFDDETVEQIPLKHTKLLIGRPEASFLTTGLEIAGYSVESVQSAYPPTFLKAVAHYSQVLPDVREMVFANPDEMIDTDRAIVAARSFSTWAGMSILKADTPIHWLPAYALFKGSIVYVPAAVVYTQSPFNQQGIFERTSAGQAVDTTYQATLTTGLLSALSYELMRQVEQGQGTLFEIDLENWEVVNADLKYLVQSVRRFGRNFKVFQLKSSAPISLFIATTTDNPQLTGIGFALSRGDALTIALRDLMGQIQAKQSPALAAYFSPLSSLWSRIIPNDGTMSIPTEQENTIKEVEDYLQQKECEVLFVNTTTADIWDGDTLISGTVLLLSRDKEEQEQ